jgi:hypothetical protein
MSGAKEHNHNNKVRKALFAYLNLHRVGICVELGATVCEVRPITRSTGPIY